MPDPETDQGRSVDSVAFHLVQIELDMKDACWKASECFGIDGHVVYTS